MKKRSVFLSWLGKAEIKRQKESGESGISFSIKKKKFDEVHILGNIEPEKAPSRDGDLTSPIYSLSSFKTFCRDLENLEISKVFFHPFKLSSPTNFKEIYESATEVIQGILERNSKEVSLTYHLTSGTGSMIATWILIAKTKFPGEMVETSFPGRVDFQKVDVPFEIRADFIPELIRQKDQTITESLSGPPKDLELLNKKKIILRSPQIKDIYEKALNYAPREVTVLILGETGTGKERVAEYIHENSLRKGKAFAKINCGAFSESLLMSELFGYDEGAFTGAKRTGHPGKFEAANGGTIFLDEIGELSKEAQAAVLRTLENKEVCRLNSNYVKKIDVRVIAATNRDLSQWVKEGKFREDLFYRLAIAMIKIPPLRERSGDIEPLIDHYSKKYFYEFGIPRKKFSQNGKDFLISYPWPGNVRELVNTIQRIILNSMQDLITEKEILSEIVSVPTATDIMGWPLNKLPEVLEVVEKEYIEKALHQTHGNISRAFSLVGMNSPAALRYRMEKLGIEKIEEQR